jgi:putative DNA primase/helicase
MSSSIVPTEIRKKGKRKRRAARSSIPNLLDYKWSDSGNAERLLVLFGHDIRYCPEMKQWMMWSGKHWRVDKGRKIRCLGVKTMRALSEQGEDLEADDESRKGFKKFIKKFSSLSENSKGVTNMLVQAAAMGNQLEADKMDTDPWLLNCLNGTIDLRSGELRTHTAGDFITKVCQVEYDPGAKCETFLSFVLRIMGNRQELCDYLQRVMGYCLTGLVTEKALFCFFGAGDNGKTTFLELFRWLLGPYATQVLIESLMSAANQTSASTLADLADLQGARFVTTSEAEEGQRLAEAKIKYLTGMGEVKSCRKYENPVTFKPTHKVFLDANHRPIVRGSDKAIWGRLKPIAFTVTIPEAEKDKHLLEKLKADAAGILAWAVQGCLHWQRTGLNEPAEVETESTQWKADNDPLREFIEDRCDVGPQGSISVTHLYQEYAAWAEQTGEKPLTKRLLSSRLTTLGFKQERNAIERFWVGIGMPRHSGLQPDCPQRGTVDSLNGRQHPLIGFDPLADANVLPGRTRARRC